MVTVVRARRGFSLAEAVTATTCCSVLAATAIAVMMGMTRADRRMTARLQASLSLAALVEQVRQDVHEAASVRWDAPMRLLEIRRPDGGTIEYRGKRRHWERRERAPGAQEGELNGVFRVARSVAWQVEPSASEAGELMRFRWLMRPDERFASRDEPAQTALLTVEVGRDERLLHE